MAASSILSILHVSDFHFSKRKAREQEIVVDALVADIEALCIGHRQPDLVVFTGDLVNAPGEDSHFEAYDAFLGKVAAAAKCSDERILIAPGNHDAERNWIKQRLGDHEKWRSSADDMAQINGSFQDGVLASVAEKFECFTDLEQVLSASSQTSKNPFATTYWIPALNVDVLVINTAAFSSGGLSALGADLSRLAVPEYAVRDAIKAFHLGSFRVVATHHPLAWLSETSAKFLRSTIQQNGDLHLFGHMHEPISANITGFEGELYSDQAGAIFAGRDRYIGYSLISVETEKRLFETHLRTFFKDRTCFDEAVDVIPQGRFYSSQEARQFWRSIATPVDVATFRNHLVEDCLPALLKEADHLGLGDRDMHDLFVPAPMKRTILQPTESDEPETTLEVPVNFESLLTGEANHIIYASPEFGRTTLLRELQYRFLKNAGSLHVPRMPVLIEFGDIKQNADNLLRFVRARAVCTTEPFSFDSLLKLGHICLLIDDVDFADRQKVAILNKFVTRYPKVRYVFTSLRSSAAPFGAVVDPEMPVSFEMIELCAYRRHDMRQLVTKWSGRSDVDQLLDRIQQEIGEINLPFTAANGTILMVILEEQSGFRPVNRSVLVEQYVDINLRKASIEQSQRETFDYHNKTALLANLAAWMAKEDVYIPSQESFRGAVKSYIERIEVNVNINALIDEFIACRILRTRSDSRISFRYRAVLEYFIALQMQKDEDFRDWVLEEERYLSFSNEVLYYAGAVRNDVDLLDKVGARFEVILGEIDRLAGGVDLSKLESLELPREDDEALSLDNLAQQLSEQPLSEEDRDAELETDIPKDAEDRQEVFRPKIDEDGHKLLASLLLYSGLIKNLEEITGSKKREHLAVAWRGWGTFLQLSLHLVPELAKKRRLRINGVLYEIAAPRGLSDKALARRILLGMPVGVSSLIAGSLGTEKLEPQLNEPRLDDQGPLVLEFFRSSLIGDLRLPSTAGALTTALNRLRPSRYLSEVIIHKIAELRRYDRIAASSFKKIAPAVAESMAAIGGAKGKVFGTQKRAALRKLDRQGLLLKLRKQRDIE